MALSLMLIALILAAVAVIDLKIRRTNSRALAKIPTLGPDGLLSYGTAIYSIFNQKGLILLGYKRHPIFKIPQFGRWTVIVADQSYIHELQKAPNSVLSLSLAVHEMMQVEYTLGSPISYNPYHIPLCGRLNRHINDLFPEVFDEITLAMKDMLCGVTDEFSSVNALDVVTHVISRASNRAFVGLPLCRDRKYLALIKDFAPKVLSDAIVIGCLPQPVREIAARMLGASSGAVFQATNYLAPLIEECTNGEHNNIFLGWLLEKARGDERTNEALARRILTLNFAALHTTVSSFVHALYHIAASQEYAAAIRAEVEAIVASDGWTTKSLDRMHKLDSFMKECMRFEGLGCVSVLRKCIEDFAFSDGICIPKGSFVCVAASGIHSDPEFYKDADRFIPWRFVGEIGQGSRMTDVSPSYVPFGGGRHACPGRFFASYEQKSLMAQLLLHYDFQFSGQGTRPANIWVAEHCIPNPNAKLFVRRRSYD